MYNHRESHKTNYEILWYLEMNFKKNSKSHEKNL